MQITSAMKMVSAAKLKRAQDAITQMRPYANKLTELLEGLSSGLDTSEGGLYAQKRNIKNVLLVVVTSNRGLCGGFIAGTGGREAGGAAQVAEAGSHQVAQDI